jgi:hypothetical protein
MLLMMYFVNVSRSWGKGQLTSCSRKSSNYQVRWSDRLELGSSKLDFDSFLGKKYTQACLLVESRHIVESC